MGVKDLQDLKKIAMLRSQIESKTVEDIMDTEYPSIGPDEKLNDALLLMKDTGYQDIPVVDDGEYIGTICYGSILKKKSIALDSRVRNLINTPPVITKDMGLTKVAEIMILNNLRQVPVVNSNKKKIIGCIGRMHSSASRCGIRVSEYLIQTNRISSTSSIPRSRDTPNLPVLAWDCISSGSLPSCGAAG